jgi:integrase
VSVYRATARNERTQRWEQRGSYIVERKLLGINVRKRTAFYERQGAEDFERCLLKLAKHGRRDLIEAFGAGHISAPELLAGVEGYGVTFQLTVSSTVRLRRAMHDWLRTAHLADKTRREYRYNLSALVGKLPPINRPPTDEETKAIARGPVLRELPALLARYARRATASSFTQAKAAAQSFVRDTVPKGHHSELWRDVASIQGPQATDRDVQGGLTPELARTVAERLGRLGPMWWTMCCTGMGNKEYWHLAWQVLADRIFIRGVQKGRMEKPRDRIVPILTTPVRPLLSEKRFAKVLAKVGADLRIEGLTPYVARRTFAHFLELAKTPDSQCDALMGHSPKGMRGRYREHDIAPYLPAIKTALRQAIGPDPVYVRAIA